jgi:DNA-binding LytR/AlgR family response regulator
MIRAVAVDDEPLALEVIRKYCSETPVVSLENTFTDAIQALVWVKAKKTDLIILDIQMPDISGIQFVSSLKEKPWIVFTTAYPEYAVTGFELEAVDYLVKPIRFERFIRAIKKVEQRISIFASPAIPDEGDIFVKSGYQSIRVLFRDIRYIEGFDDYIKIHLISCETPVVSLMSLKSIQERIPENLFMRVHRSYIVPLKQVIRVRNKYIYLMKDKLPIGDTYYNAVLLWLSGSR